MSISFGSKAGLSLRTAGPALRPPISWEMSRLYLVGSYRTVPHGLLTDHGQHSCGTLVYYLLLVVRFRRAEMRLEALAEVHTELSQRG